MWSFIQWILGSTPIYLVTVTYTKKLIPVRSKYSRHKGYAINNSRSQFTVRLDSPLDLIDTTKNAVTGAFPNAININIEDIKRVN